MTRTLFLSVMALALASTGCPGTSGVLYAKIAVAGCRTATDVCQAGFDEAAKAKTQVCNDAVCKKLDPSGGKDYQACMKKDHSANPDWKTCYKPMVEAQAKWAKAKPMLLEAWKTADNAIKAAEQKKAGETPDYMTPIKNGICTLTKVAPLLPKKWQDKIAWIVKMAEGFACGKTSNRLTPDQQLRWLVTMRATMTQILRNRGA